MWGLGKIDSEINGSRYNSRLYKFLKGKITQVGIAESNSKSIEIENVINNLKINKSSGYDRIGDAAVIYSSSRVSEILKHIFNTTKYTWGHQMNGRSG